MASKKAHIVFDSIQYQNEDGSWAEALRDDHPDGIEVPADEYKRLEDLGAVVGSKKKAEEAAPPEPGTVEEGAAIGEAHQTATEAAEENKPAEARQPTERPADEKSSKK